MSLWLKKKEKSSNLPYVLQLHLFPVQSLALRLTDILDSCNGDAEASERDFIKCRSQRWFDRSADSGG